MVVNDPSALPEVVGQAGLAAADNDVAFADAIQGLLDSDVGLRRGRGQTGPSGSAGPRPCPGSWPRTGWAAEQKPARLSPAAP